MILNTLNTAFFIHALKFEVLFKVVQILSAINIFISLLNFCSLNDRHINRMALDSKTDGP